MAYISVSDPLNMAGLRSSHLFFLSTILLFVISGSPVVNGKSTGEISSYSGTGHPSLTADTYDITDTFKCPKCFSIYISNP